VKPPRYLNHPEIVESRGWEYRVDTEPPRVSAENVRFLAGYRRSWLIPEEPLARLRSAESDPGMQTIELPYTTRRSWTGRGPGAVAGYGEPSEGYAQLHNGMER
jgi:hypothetical protein